MFRWDNQENEKSLDMVPSPILVKLSILILISISIYWIFFQH